MAHSIQPPTLTNKAYCAQWSVIHEDFAIHNTAPGIF